MEENIRITENSVYAHISAKCKNRQTLCAHSQTVARLCESADAANQFPTLAYLAGLLHDMGKGTRAFQDYLLWSATHPGEKKNHPNHAATGAIYCWEHWKDIDKLTAQILALCISAHHTGLSDCLKENGTSEFLEKMSCEERKSLYYEEAARFFEDEIRSFKELDRLFAKASDEISTWQKTGPNYFDAGSTVRLLLSILVDADRLDSASYENGENVLLDYSVPDWNAMILSLQTYLKTTFPAISGLDHIRSDISDNCADGAERERGVFSLTVPTGGGKTFASLRFALLHAKKHSMKRIFYIIPYNTILDQNAEDIQNALGNSTSVLVHHANIVKEDEKEEENYRRLTERWDSEIILTSLVQFLNALFQGKNTNARRMKQLTDAVLIFDEIQLLPLKCKELFKKAIRYLVKYCRCTAVLCTATQPEIFTGDFRPTELIENKDELFRKLERVRYIPELEGKDNANAAAKLCSLLNGGSSVLCVVNTKRVAWSLFEKARVLLREEGWTILSLSDQLKEDELEQRAATCGPHEILCVHLSTSLCPEHRIKYIHEIKAWTKARKPVFCVSTALIEAGINVSFPVVVRSIAGLPSIIQAAGRCNRNREAEKGIVYIWRLAEEADSLKYLPQIRDGGNILSSMMDIQMYRDEPDRLGTPEAISAYFNREEKLHPGEEKYPFREDSLVSMLSNNRKCLIAAQSLKDQEPQSLPLHQSFHTVGDAFRVIDNETTGVLVPYGAGEDLILKLSEKSEIQEQRRLLRKAQAYSVGLYEQLFREFVQRGIVTEIGDTGVFVLQKEYYDADGGVVLSPGEMDFYHS